MSNEKSIEVYDDKFARNINLTRSARIRKFKFYQYKPIRNTTNTTPTIVTNSTPNSFQPSPPQSPSPAILTPREDVLNGEVALIIGQSKELVELDEEIKQLEKKISDLNSNGSDDINKLDEIFNLVNKKNDLLRRQMQLNILEQEKVLEKTNEELTKELRSLLNIDDSRKTQVELERQQYLYDQLVALVNKRNDLVSHMDVQERGIDEDNAVKERLKTAISSRKIRTNGQDHCCIQ